MKGKIRIMVVLGLCVSLLSLVVASPGAMAEKKGLIAYSVCWTEDPFWVASVDAARTMVEHLGYEFKGFNAANENLRQVEQLSDIIALEPDALIVSAVDSRGIIGGIRRVKDAGIPVIVIIRTIKEAGKIAFTGKSDMYGIGQKAAINLLYLLRTKYGDYKGKVLEVMGELGDEASVEFHAGFISLMRKFPEIELTSKEAEAWSFEKAADIVEDWLTAYPDTDGIYSHSDWLTQAFPPVLKRLGYKPIGEEPHMLLVSSGAMPFGLPFVREGFIDMTTEIPILKVSKIAAYWAVKLAEGEKIPAKARLIEPGMSVEFIDATVEVVSEDWGPTMVVPPKVVSKINADDPTIWGNIYK